VTILKSMENWLRHTVLHDAYVISYPKCGRTWLNSILLHYVRRHYDGIAEPLTFEWSPPMVRHTWHRRFPNVCFTHGIARHAIPYQELVARFDPARYIAKRSVLLVRDPRDVVVSYYHHAMKKTEKNKLPPTMSLSDFVRHEAYGIRSIVAFYNLWAPVIEEHANVSWCRYEDLKADAVGTVRRLLEFFEAPVVDQEALVWAVEMNRFENLQARERDMKRARGAQPDSNKLRIRKGKTGGYRSEMQAVDIKYAEDVMNKHLSHSIDFNWHTVPQE
jgi:hypothetical protein